MIQWERLDIKNVDGSACDLPIAKRVKESVLVNDWPSGGVHEPCCSLHQADFGSRHQPFCSLTKNQVDSQNIRLPEQFFLGHPARTALPRLFRFEVLAPCDHVHSERVCDARNLGADIAEAKDPQHFPSNSISHR